MVVPLTVFSGTKLLFALRQTGSFRNITIHAGIAWIICINLLSLCKLECMLLLKYRDDIILYTVKNV